MPELIAFFVMAEEVANDFDTSSSSKEGSSVCPICLVSTLERGKCDYLSPPPASTNSIAELSLNQHVCYPKFLF